jgi:hypothetical protein
VSSFVFTGIKKEMGQRLVRRGGFFAAYRLCENKKIALNGSIRLGGLGLIFRDLYSLGLPSFGRFTYRRQVNLGLFKV